MSRVMNAFQSVRPRAAVATPVYQPLSRGRGSDIQLSGSMGVPRVLNISGRPMATLAPSVYHAPVIESRLQAQASADKRHALVKGGI